MRLIPWLICEECGAKLADIDEEEDKAIPCPYVKDLKGRCTDKLKNVTKTSEPSSAKPRINMAQQDSILPEGVRMFNKHDNAPDFVMGKAVISLNKLVAFCKAHPEILSDYQGEKQLTLQMLWSKQGKLYANIDLYNTPYAAGTRGAPFATASSAPQGTQAAPPKPPTAPSAPAATQPAAATPPAVVEDDLPF